MKKILLLGLMILMFSQSVFADPISRILKVVGQISQYDQQISTYTSDIEGVDKNILDNNKKQLTDLDSIISGLTGTHSYGGMNYDSSQFNWGNGSDSWQSLLSLYKTGGGGDLARLAGNLGNEYPISDNLGSSSNTENEYYRLQAQTTLASRASSQLAFDQVSKESKVISTLHDQIDQAKDNKSSVDLNNRLVSEQNQMSIQQTKLLAALVQQAAVDSQEHANHAKENSEFFDYKK
jgi:hypothetical protein